MSNLTSKACLTSVRTVISETEKLSFQLLNDKTITGTSYDLVYNINQKAHKILKHIDIYF
jgi:hypothetical protein